MGWTPAELADLTGKTYIITGGNSGLGLEAARILAGKNARVVITARSEAKAGGALKTIRETVPDADLDYVLLDLSDQDSVRRAAAELLAKCERIDAVINNAGVMQTPERRTKEGWELQLATNHIGHFHLNSLLIERLEASEGRIVAVSSIAHKMGRLHFDDMMFDKGYSPTDAYGQSKLANIMYAFELQRHLDKRGSKVTAYAAHPGYASTNLQSAGVGMEGGSTLFRWMYKVTNTLMAQSAEEGAYPLLLAAADSDAKAGAYYGPTWMMDSRGPVGECSIAPHAQDEAAAAKLWERTEGWIGPFFDREAAEAEKASA